MPTHTATVYSTPSPRWQLGSIGLGQLDRKTVYSTPSPRWQLRSHWAQKTDRPGTVQTINVMGLIDRKTVFPDPSPHTPAFVVLGTWAVVLMFRDYSRALGLVGLSRLRLVRLPFGMEVHVRRLRTRQTQISSRRKSATSANAST